jgi:hypothetical protein
LVPAWFLRGSCVQLCNDWAIGGKGGLGKVKGQLWGLDTVVLSFLDWPLRK